MQTGVRSEAMADLGEQAISKVAEVGLASQLDEADNLDVEVQTDPLKLMTGQVEAVSVKGEGLVMQQDLRIEEMQLQTGNISINPLSVAFGSIELTRPTEAETQVVLTEADINRAFNSDFIRSKLTNLHIQVEGQAATVDSQQVEFGLPGNGKVALSTTVKLHDSDQTRQVAFTAVPKVAADGQSVALEAIEYSDGQELSPELTEALRQEAAELLNLRNFELSGMSLRLQRLDVQPGKLVLQASALIEKFPSET